MRPCAAPLLRPVLRSTRRVWARAARCDLVHDRRTRRRRHESCNPTARDPGRSRHATANESNDACPPLPCSGGANAGRRVVAAAPVGHDAPAEQRRAGPMARSCGACTASRSTAAARGCRLNSLRWKLPWSCTLAPSPNHSLPPWQHVPHRHRSALPLRAARSSRRRVFWSRATRRPNSRCCSFRAADVRFRTQG